MNFYINICTAPVKSVKKISQDLGEAKSSMAGIKSAVPQEAGIYI
jgi:hypothetical protein